MTVSVPTNTLNKDFVAKYKLSQSVRSGGFGRVYKVNSTDETKKSDSVVKFIYKSKIHQLLDNEETEFFKNCSCLKTLQPEKLPYEILILKN
ncbi:hypothetical protein HK099_008077 [Clydaea vesicula]|uniref:Protein kinase domain-containing protein n=1 Tax=Clydaea vesicula TaxID=447962 RepID=A0AAD5TVR5_9FUNG|nr:hypothetical protein HK099_008077 [Clydaea vesicula]